MSKRGIDDFLSGNNLSDAPLDAQLAALAGEYDRLGSQGIHASPTRRSLGDSMVEWLADKKDAALATERLSTPWQPAKDVLAAEGIDYPASPVEAGYNDLLTATAIQNVQDKAGDIGQLLTAENTLRAGAEGAIDLGATLWGLGSGISGELRRGSEAEAQRVLEANGIPAAVPQSKGSFAEDFGHGHDRVMAMSAARSVHDAYEEAFKDYPEIGEALSGMLVDAGMSLAFPGVGGTGLRGVKAGIGMADKARRVFAPMAGGVIGGRVSSGIIDGVMSDDTLTSEQKNGLGTFVGILAGIGTGVITESALTGALAHARQDTLLARVLNDSYATAVKKNVPFSEALAQNPDGAKVLGTIGKYTGKEVTPDMLDGSLKRTLSAVRRLDAGEPMQPGDREIFANLDLRARNSLSSEDVARISKAGTASQEEATAAAETLLFGRNETGFQNRNAQLFSVMLMGNVHPRQIMQLRSTMAQDTLSANALLGIDQTLAETTSRYAAGMQRAVAAEVADYNTLAAVLRRKDLPADVRQFASDQLAGVESSLMSRAREGYDFFVSPGDLSGQVSRMPQALRDRFLAALKEGPVERADVAPSTGDQREAKAVANVLRKMGVFPADDNGASDAALATIVARNKELPPMRSGASDIASLGRANYLRANYPNVYGIATTSFPSALGGGKATERLSAMRGAMVRTVRAINRNALDATDEEFETLRPLLAEANGYLDDVIHAEGVTTSVSASLSTYLKKQVAPNATAPELSGLSARLVHDNWALRHNPFARVQELAGGDAPVAPENLFREMGRTSFYYGADAKGRIDFIDYVRGLKREGALADVFPGYNEAAATETGATAWLDDPEEMFARLYARSKIDGLIPVEKVAGLFSSADHRFENALLWARENSPVVTEADDALRKAVLRDSIAPRPEDAIYYSANDILKSPALAKNPAFLDEDGAKKFLAGLPRLAPGTITPPPTTRAGFEEAGARALGEALKCLYNFEGADAQELSRQLKALAENFQHRGTKTWKNNVDNLYCEQVGHHAEHQQPLVDAVDKIIKAVDEGKATWEGLAGQVGTVAVPKKELLPVAQGMISIRDRYANIRALGNAAAKVRGVIDFVDPGYARELSRAEIAAACAEDIRKAKASKRPITARIRGSDRSILKSRVAERASGKDWETPAAPSSTERLVSFEPTANPDTAYSRGKAWATLTTALKGIYMGYSGLEYDPEGVYIPGLGNCRWSLEKAATSGPLAVLCFPGATSLVGKGARGIKRSLAALAKKNPAVARLGKLLGNSRFVFLGNEDPEVAVALGKGAAVKGMLATRASNMAKFMYSSFTPTERESIARLAEGEKSWTDRAAELYASNPALMDAVNMVQQFYRELPSYLKELGMADDETLGIVKDYVNRRYLDKEPKARFGYSRGGGGAVINGSFALPRGHKKNLAGAEVAALQEAFKAAGADLKVGARVDEWVNTENKRMRLYVPEGVNPGIEGFEPRTTWGEGGNAFTVTKLDSNRVRLNQDFTLQERKDFGEVADISARMAALTNTMFEDIRRGTVYAYMAGVRSIARKPAGKEDRAALEAQGWVLVPKTQNKETGIYNYGKLAGMYVSPEANRALSWIGGQWDIGGALKARLGKDSGVRKCLDAYTKVLSLWKANKTVLTPTAHVNNFMSNAIMGYLQGRNPVSDFARGLRLLKLRDLEMEAERAYARMDMGPYHISRMQLENSPDYAVYKNAKEVGLLNSTYYRSEHSVGDIQEKIEKALKGEKGVVQLPRFMAALCDDVARKWESLMEKTGTWYDNGDLVYKLGGFANDLETGLAPAKALDSIYASYFDYGNLPPAADFLRSTGIVPFAAYTFRAIPNIYKAVRDHPDRVITAALMLEGIHLASVNTIFSGSSSGLLEKREAYDKTMPQYAQGTSLGGILRGRIALPTDLSKTADVNAANLPFLDLSRMMPGGDMMLTSPADTAGMDYDLFSMATPANLLYTLINQSPFISFASAVATGQNPAFGSPVFTGSDMMEVPEVAARRESQLSDLFLQTMLPNLPFLPGTPAYHKLREGLAGANTLPYDGASGLDSNGEPVGLGRAAAYGFGLRVYDNVPMTNWQKEALRDKYEFQREKSAMKKVFASPRSTDAQKLEAERTFSAAASGYDERTRKTENRFRRILKLHRETQSGGTSLPR